MEEKTDNVRFFEALTAQRDIIEANLMASMRWYKHGMAVYMRRENPWICKSENTKIEIQYRRVKNKIDAARVHAMHILDSENPQNDFLIGKENNKAACNEFLDFVSMSGIKVVPSCDRLMDLD